MRFKTIKQLDYNSKGYIRQLARDRERQESIVELVYIPRGSDTVNYHHLLKQIDNVLPLNGSLHCLQFEVRESYYNFQDSKSH